MGMVSDNLNNIAGTIKDLRQSKHLSQSQLGSLVGVSEEAVSDWENGTATPTIDNVLRLKELFGISLDELCDERSAKKSVSTIVLTGGPCAGKTTAISQIESYFSQQGYKVLCIPETATELILAGIAPWSMKTNIDFQTELFKLQLAKEEVFQRAAQKMPDEKTLIVCDRGLMDCCAYTSDAELTVILHRVGMTEIEARDRYDAIFHLVTAAKGAETFYTTGNNAARTETPEEAAALDDRVVEAWTGHPHLRVIGNETSFEDKLMRLKREISSFLGEPEPYETERKFLIRRPSAEVLSQLQASERVDILQTYLTSSDGVERRVRQRGSRGNYTYTLTEKRPVSGLKRIETETRLSLKEYLSLLMSADPTCKPIRKQRYCLVYENQYLEIDIYPFWKDKAILEVELSDEDQEVRLPDSIEVIREVTDDMRFKNRALAISHDIDEG